MVTAKHLQSRFCSFNITAADEDEMVKHAMIHKAEHHANEDITEMDIQEMDKNIEVPQQRL